jgi:2-polyprenyl-3-methyl-5-hydroxy-6-metoxy-1,4-benzoquinol methylase
MLRYLKTLINRTCLSYVREINRRDYSGQQFAGVNERPIEYGFVFRQLTRSWPQTVLDVGTGLTALPQLMRTCGFLVTATDNIRDYWPSTITNRHFFVIDDDITETRIRKTFDFITCISVLEHIPRHDDALRSLSALLNPGGHLVVTFPYNEDAYVPNVYELKGSTTKEQFPFVTQAFSRRELDKWVSDNRLTIQEQEYWQFFTGEYWTIGERVTPPTPVSKEEKHQLTCLLLLKPIPSPTGQPPVVQREEF